MDNSNNSSAEKNPTSENPSGHKSFLYTKSNSGSRSRMFSSLFNSKTLGLMALFIIIAAVPFTVFITQKQQETRQRASGTTPSCSVAKTDTMLIIDRSTSMTDNNSDKLAKAKEAAKIFVDKIAIDGKSKVGLVSFAGYSSLDNSLTTDYLSVKSKIDAIISAPSTCTECGVKRANGEILANKSDGVKKVVILLTDGRANTILDPAYPYPFPSITSVPTIPPDCKDKTSCITTVPVGTNAGVNLFPDEIIKYTPDFAVAEKSAFDAVIAGFQESNTVFYTIGLGTEIDVNSKFLTDIATATGGKYYYAPDPAQLDAIYTEISQIIGKGSVSGFVFNDADDSKSYTTGDTKLSRWTVELKDQTSQTVGSSQTADTGDFDITGLCDGSYKLSLVPQSGFAQTVPNNPEYFTINVANGSSVPDNNFGVKSSGTTITPTITVTPPAGTQHDIIGKVWIDTNNNGLYDPTIDANYLGGAKVDLESSGATPQTATTDTEGNYYFRNLPNGQYSVTITLSSASGYAIAPPNNTNPVSITIDNNSQQYSWANFSVAPTDTLTPTVTPTVTLTLTPTLTPNPSITATLTPTSGATNGVKLAFALKLQAIGKNENIDPNHPTASENPEPKTPTRELTVEVFDAQNVKQGDGTGSIIYDSTDGLFRGTVDVNNLVTGSYFIKVKTDKYLKRLIGKETNQTIQHLTAGSTPNPMPQSTLVIGDINNDNHLNMDDYNVYYSCWGNRAGSSACLDPGKVDLNDDKIIDGRTVLKDYAWLFYSFEVQEGD